MNTQPERVRVPPSLPPRTRHASGFFEPERSRRRASFWSEVRRELGQFQWPEARDVAARMAAVLGFISLWALFGMVCSAAASVLTRF